MVDGEKTRWFEDARFGLFLHWGLYAIPAGEWRGERMDYIGEWLQSRFRIPNAEYSLLAEQFNPTAFDADAWVQLAQRAGMGYLVITSKHHDGFALFKSEASDYNAVDATPWGRDAIRELAEACARHGLTFGLYYSQALDWHEPDGADPGPEHLNHGSMRWGNDWDFPDRDAKCYDRYFAAKVKPQLREILTHYGPLGLIWFDTPFVISREQSQELCDLVHELQPECLVNTRVGHGLGDYSSLGDNQVPYGRVKGVWETPATLNDTWGYKHFDQHWKSAADTLGILAGLADRGVNYLLNIGPQPDGAFPPASVAILHELGDWMEHHREAIVGTRANPFGTPFDWGWCTQRAGRLYLLLRDWPTGRFCLRGLSTPVTGATLLGPAPVALALETGSNPADDAAELWLDLPAVRPDVAIPVVALDLAGPAVTDTRLIGQHGGVVLLPADRAALHAESAQPPALDQRGILTGWRDAADWVSWEVCVPAAGAYGVELVTAALWHSHPWQGGHTVRLEVEGDACEGALTLDAAVQRPEARYYALGQSTVGTLRFGQAGEQTLRLRPVTILPGGGGLALVAVRLSR